jgi:hypothetical protein
VNHMASSGTSHLSTSESQRGKEQREFQEPGSQKFSHETGRGLPGVVLRVMKCVWHKWVIRIKNAVTRFRDGGSQTKPVPGGGRDVIITSACRAWSNR